MAKKKVTDDDVKLFRARVQEGKAIVGTDRVLKGIKSGSLKKLFIASNCPAKVREDILHYAKLASVPVVELGYTNEEMGVFCKKNFLISVLGLIEE